MKPLSNVIPKTLLPINDHAVLYWNILGFTDLKFDEIGIVVNQANHQIILDFLKQVLPKTTVSIFEQDEPLGLVDAIRSANKFEGEDLLIMAGDTIIDTHEIKKITTLIKGKKADVVIGITKRSKHEIFRRSNVHLNDKFEVKKVIEKPQESSIVGNWSGVPIWGITAKMWEFLNKSTKSDRGEYDLSDVLNIAIEKNFCVKGVKITSSIDLTHPLDVLVNNFPYIRELLDI
jgi:dTDP-glucose pyrophosphorylase